MPASKAVLLATVILAAAGSFGAVMGLALRPAKPAPVIAAPLQAIAPQPQQALPPPNCSTCPAPPAELCIPAGLSLNCQQCIVNVWNAAGITPNPIIYDNGRGWYYEGLQGNSLGTSQAYGYLRVYLPTCP